MKTKKPIPVAIPGDYNHNTIVSAMIGNLIIQWSVCESALLAMMTCLLGEPKNTVAAIWSSHTNTRNRVDLLSNLASIHISDTEIKKACVLALGHFYSLTKTRNFWCHAAYFMEATGKYYAAQSFESGTAQGFRRLGLNISTRRPPMKSRMQQSNLSI